MAAYRRVDDLVTCRLTTCIPGSAPGPTLSDGYGKLFFTFLHCTAYIDRISICLSFTLHHDDGWATDSTCILAKPASNHYKQVRLL